LAEGCGRWGDGDMGRFIQIAMGSASELHNLLLLASDLSYIEYIEQTEKAKLLGDILEVRRMLTALFKRVRRVPIVK
jgi:four helix bundle protein